MVKGYLVTGTDTGVGKTVITAGLTGVWRRHGVPAVAIKPVQSGAVLHSGDLIPEDVAFYRLAAGLNEPLDELNLYRFAPAVSPHLAATLSGEKVLPARLVHFCREALRRHRLTLVEGAGGLGVPLSGPQFTVADLCRELALSLLVVARPGLGSINHTVLTVSYARSYGLEVTGIIINGLRPEAAGPTEKDNPGVIETMTGVPVLGIVPYLPGVSVEEGRARGLVDAVERAVDWRALLEA
ncbi:ATP-dependent dethiobiotin synthetase BioD 1 [Moorella thermoacetica]|uniref:dethiobiotin synthase n=1 Tax=Neomoorella thermoacetica TaxID=1525 RepID=UPI0030CC1FEE